jgi:hypothetical protein
VNSKAIPKAKELFTQIEEICLLFNIYEGRESLLTIGDNYIKKLNRAIEELSEQADEINTQDSESS